MSYIYHWKRCAVTVVAYCALAFLFISVTPQTIRYLVEHPCSYIGRHACVVLSC